VENNKKIETSTKLRWKKERRRKVAANVHKKITARKINSAQKDNKSQNR